MTRKIIQTSTIPAPNSVEASVILALCDDGTLWILRYFDDDGGYEWTLFENVPQHSCDLVDHGYPPETAEA